jgi:hypothetical protein
MKSTFFVFIITLSSVIFSQETIKKYSLMDVEVFPVFYQIEMQPSQKNNLLLFKAKMQQYFITNMDSKNLVHFEDKNSYSLDLQTTLDGKLTINNLSVFNSLQKESIEKVLKMLHIKKAALKNGQDVAVEFSISLQLKFTEIKTIK